MDRPLKYCSVLADSKSYHRMSYHHALVAAAVGLILLLVLLASRQWLGLAVCARSTSGDHRFATPST